MNHELYSWLTIIPENVTQGVDVAPITALQNYPSHPGYAHPGTHHLDEAPSQFWSGSRDFSFWVGERESWALSLALSRMDSVLIGLPS